MFKFRQRFDIREVYVKSSWLIIGCDKCLWPMCYPKQA